MTEKVRLTQPQLLLLDDLSFGDRHVNPSYKPGQKLVELGFARRRGPMNDVMEITEDGRKRLLQEWRR